MRKEQKRTEGNGALRRGLFCIAALSLFWASNVLAQAATDTYREVGPVAQSFYTCSGDFVSLWGEGIWVFHTTLDDSGGFHASAHVTAHLEGTGDPSGETYRLTINYEFEGNGVVGDEQTASAPVILVGQGSAGNLQGENTFHYTINANGEPTAYFDNSTFHCQD